MNPLKNGILYNSFLLVTACCPVTLIWKSINILEINVSSLLISRGNRYFVSMVLFVCVCVCGMYVRIT